jgi:hypothetical protein
LLIAKEIAHSLRATPVDLGVLSRVSIFEPAAAIVLLSHIFTTIQAPLINLAAWLVPLLLMAWIVVSSIGRTAVMRRADPALHKRPVALMGLQAVRMIALLASFVLWFGCLRWAMDFAVIEPMAIGHEPSLVLFCALAIVTTLGLFTLWLIASWIFWASPLLAMLRDQGALASLRAALRLGALKSKLVEINLVMGIVKIALVMSSCPLPFESVATPDFMQHWYEFTAIVYFAASDFFHVVRLAAYLKLWRIYTMTPNAT